MEQNKERKTLSKKDVVKSFWRWTFFLPRQLQL